MVETGGDQLRQPAREGTCFLEPVPETINVSAPSSEAMGCADQRRRQGVRHAWLALCRDSAASATLRVKVGPVRGTRQSVARDFDSQLRGRRLPRPTHVALTWGGNLRGSQVGDAGAPEEKCYHHQRQHHRPPDDSPERDEGQQRSDTSQDRHASRVTDFARTCPATQASSLTTVLRVLIPMMCLRLSLPAAAAKAAQQNAPPLASMRTAMTMRGVSSCMAPLSL